MMWAAEPHLEARKQLGFRVISFLLVLPACSTSPRRRSGRRSTATRSRTDRPAAAAQNSEKGSGSGPFFVGGRAPGLCCFRTGGAHDQGRARHHRRIRHLRSARPEDIREERVESPWGEPSDALRFGRIGGTPIVFLPRHGRGHSLSPSDINYRANIDALKRAGVTDIVSLSACGSFKPGTAARALRAGRPVRRPHPSARELRSSAAGCVAHVSMAHPVGPRLAQRLAAAARGGRHRRPARRDLCLHGGAAILQLCRNPHLPGISAMTSSA